MSYNIKLTNGSTIYTIADGTYDNTHTSLTLVGRNYSNYGQIMTDNLVHLLENFSYSSSPVHPLVGQIWWDLSTGVLKVCTDNSTTPIWKVVGGATSAAVAPTTTTAGDLWWDYVNQQFYIYNGTTPYSSNGWVLVGPTYQSGNGKSGAIWEIIQDIDGGTHHVVSIYLDGTRTAIISQDDTFTPSITIIGFNTVRQGWNMNTSNTIWGTANNASYLGNQPAANYFRNNQNNTGTGSLTLTNDSGITVGAGSDLTLSVNDIDAKITNHTNGGDVDIYAKTEGVSTRYIHIEGTTGAVEVAADPTTTLGIATKHYVDNQTFNTNLTGTPTAVTAPPGTNTTQIATTAFVYQANLSLKGYIDAADALKAPIASPVFTGDPRAPTPTAGDNDTSIATTAFVTTAVASARAYGDTNVSYKANIASPTFTGNPKAPHPDENSNDYSIATSFFVTRANIALKGYIDAADALKAPIASPIFSGNPQAPTPTQGDNDNSIATTAFVTTAVASARAHTDDTASSINADISGKANIASPTFTGDPKAPTPALGDNDTSIATTAFVYQANVGLKGYVDSVDVLKAPIASPIFTGDPRAPTPAVGDNDTSIATTAFVTTAVNAARTHTDDTASTLTTDISGKADKSSPTFTGTPKAPTPADGDNDTKVATTAFIYKANIAMKGYVDTATSSLGSGLALKANIASPTFTGAPKAPHPPANDFSANIATTQFVLNAVASGKDYSDDGQRYKANIASPTFTGTPRADTAAPGTDTSQLATTAFVNQSNVGLKGYLAGQYATISSPSFVGNPNAPTPPSFDNSTSIATTAFVSTAISAVNTTIASLQLNKIFQGDSRLQIDDPDVGGLTLAMDSTTVMTATAAGVSLKNGATAVTQSQTYNSAGDSSISTTQYVKTATTWWGGSAKFVSTAAPTSGDGNDGDFWFQIAS